jgi:hypothetical protein
VTEKSTLFNRLRALIMPDAPTTAEKPGATPAKTWPDDLPDFAPKPDDEASLIDLDHSYAGMYRMHKLCHQGLLSEVASVLEARGARRFLEVAPGTGWLARSFVGKVPQYWALELSEVAIKLLVRRFPEARVINCLVEEADVIADGAFDVVFCASMLEHIGEHETALRQMIRMAGSDLFVLFYEGLGSDEDAKSQQFPFDNPDWRRWYGEKSKRYQDERGGFFMKRYARSEIDRIVRATGAEPAYLDASNRPYLRNETVLHVRKGT